MRQSTKKPTLKLKKETLRQMKGLSDQELAAIVGAGLCAPGWTCRCDRNC
jgi:hypothetical protein